MDLLKLNRDAVYNQMHNLLRLVVAQENRDKGFRMADIQRRISDAEDDGDDAIWDHYENVRNFHTTETFLEKHLKKREVPGEIPLLVFSRGYQRVSLAYLKDANQLLLPQLWRGKPGTVSEEVKEEMRLIYSMERQGRPFEVYREYAVGCSISERTGDQYPYGVPNGKVNYLVTSSFPFSYSRLTNTRMMIVGGRQVPLLYAFDDNYAYSTEDRSA